MRRAEDEWIGDAARDGADAGADETGGEAKTGEGGGGKTITEIPKAPKGDPCDLDLERHDARRFAKVRLPRDVVGGSEARVQIFPNGPVVRFTVPVDAEGGKRWSLRWTRGRRTMCHRNRRVGLVWKKTRRLRRLRRRAAGGSVDGVRRKSAAASAAASGGRGHGDDGRSTTAASGGRGHGDDGRSTAAAGSP